MPAPRGALPTSVRAQKCGMAMSVTTQIIFPYMSDARTPAMDVQMNTQDAGMPRSFRPILSAILMSDNVYMIRGFMREALLQALCTYTLQRD